MADFTLMLGWNENGIIQNYTGPGWYLRSTKEEGHLWSLEPRRLSITKARAIVGYIAMDLTPPEKTKVMAEFDSSTAKYVQSLRDKAKTADALAARARQAADELAALEEEVANV